MDDREVLVVGAGPTGLAAACQLVRWGVRVRVLDAAAGPFVGSRGKGLQPRTLELLDGFGVAGRLIATGRFQLAIRQYAADGSFVDQDRLPGAEPTPASPYARSMIVPQWRVEETLREMLAESCVEVQWGAEVVGLEQRADGVTAVLADGARVGASYLVACDGGSSAIRRLLGVPFLGETDEDIRMLVGDVVLDGLDRDHWHMFQGSAGRWVALCPLPATDSFQLQSTLRPGEPEEPSLPVFQSIVDGAVGVGRVRLRRATWMSRWRLNVRMVNRYRVDRVFLAGDAAHVHSPTGGQGMNTGIQDAVNLGWKLAHVLGGAGPALLDSYEAERLPVAAGVLKLSSELLGVGFGNRGELGTEALQLGINYRGGPLAGLGSDGGSAAGPQAGDRAPDAPLLAPDGRRVRLFELLRGPHWTLVGFDRVPVRPAGPVHVVAVGPDLVDDGGQARETYGAAPGELVLIRPDGYIGIRSTDAGAVDAYLRALGVPALSAGPVAV
ncbi:MAG TPA: FAD-dependent monooxygenase [Pseudonocardia sp.]|jgi:2-polyprenyl-6-methoxyphenol hydroxylase-like FAD-dependent oxidoreductase|nr:FAD-dependent monooxygenase [Pseudonocardia sp.]